MGVLSIMSEEIMLNGALDFAEGYSKSQQEIERSERYQQQKQYEAQRQVQEQSKDSLSSTVVNNFKGGIGAGLHQPLNTPYVSNQNVDDYDMEF